MSSTTSPTPSASSTAVPDPPKSTPDDLNPVLSFIIGLAIILGASIMNAGGLNLVKLDMVRTMALPKSQRRADFLRPIWLIGMTLYILSQLIGSTLALEFLRAEYVAPLGSSSLIFNFLFASFLVGTPITRNDIYGTLVVILGVVGIVAFGSINKGLNNGMDLDILVSLWSRPGWLVYLIVLGIIPIFMVYIGASQLDAVLISRMDPIGEESTAPTPNLRQRFNNKNNNGGWWQSIKLRWKLWMHWTRDKIEGWSNDKSEKDIAWTLGICWACCGGALAGGCLVFAKASVKLISGKLKHLNSGNQFIHPASIFTFIFLAVTAVAQIICLNRGLRVYDSTLVVPVFYGVYTASGWLNSLIFNNEVDAYETWTLFLIFSSILVLIIGVVLLTLKKPEPKKPAPGSGEGEPSSRGFRRKPRGAAKSPGNEHNGDGDHDHDRDHDDREDDEISLTEQGGSKGVTWEVGQDSDEDEEDIHDINRVTDPVKEDAQRRQLPVTGPVEAHGLMSQGEEGDDDYFGEYTSAPTK